MPRSLLADLLLTTAAAAIVPVALLVTSSSALEVDDTADQWRAARHFSVLAPVLLNARSVHETGRADGDPGAEGVTLALMVASVAELLDIPRPFAPPPSPAADVTEALMVASVAELLDVRTPAVPPPGLAGAAPSGTRAMPASLAAGAGVAGVQRGLIRLGYATGPVDGRAGPLTRAAIRAFQGDVGLPVDGEPSAVLLTRLQAASGAGPLPAVGREEPRRGRGGSSQLDARSQTSAGGSGVLGDLLVITGDDELAAIVALGKSRNPGP